MPKSIISTGFMLLGIYYFLFELAGLGMLLGFIKAGKENLPKYKEQITQIEQKIVPQIEGAKPSTNPSPSGLNPTGSNPSPNQKAEADPEFGVDFKINTPWAKLETKANSKGIKGIQFGK
jgi:hypothetical protein